MRVLAGELKGRRLAVPGGRATRPTADHVRIACLDTLMPYLAAGPFLDLFAGGGGVGIEALSRGAPSAVFVEQDALALRALRDNVAALGLEERARVLRSWAGLCDLSPDYSPILGKTEVEGFHVSSGWGTYGFKAAPIVGKTLAELAATGKTPELIEPFKLERFYEDKLVSELAAAAVSH